MIETVAVIGAGQMGNGIAHVAALAGLKTFVMDTNVQQLENAKSNIFRNLDRQLAKSVISSDNHANAQKLLVFTNSLEDCSDAELAIETVTENVELKCKVLANMDDVLHPSAIIASNTSAISITKLASATRRPDKVIGLHFMNPVPVMPLVELIQGLATSMETFATGADLVTRMGKTVIVAKDAPGFLVNRILMPMINEAVFAVYEGVGGAEDVDNAMKLGTNHPMGPLALADLIGLDTCLSIMQVLHQGFGDSKYRPCPLLVNYVAAGWLGRKTNRGFYSYERR